MSSAYLDWDIIVAEGKTSGQWFGAALAHGSRMVRTAKGDEFIGRRIHTPWMPTELAARTALDALLTMGGIV